MSVNREMSFVGSPKDRISFSVSGMFPDFPGFNRHGRRRGWGDTVVEDKR